jgi:hypothetical protein
VEEASSAVEEDGGFWAAAMSTAAGVEGAVDLEAEAALAVEEVSVGRVAGSAWAAGMEAGAGTAGGRRLGAADLDCERGVVPPVVGVRPRDPWDPAAIPAVADGAADAAA